MKHATNWFDNNSNMRVNNCEIRQGIFGSFFFFFFFAAFYDTCMIYFVWKQGEVYNLAPESQVFHKL